MPDTLPLRTQRSLDAPAQDWLGDVEAMRFLGIDSVKLFNDLVDAGLIPGVRQLNRQTRLFNWKGLVVFLLRLELGDIPQLAETRKGSREAGGD